MVFVPCSMYVRTKQYPQGKLLLALPVVWAQKERCSKESASVVPMLPPCPTDCTPRTAPWWVVLGVEEKGYVTNRRGYGKIYVGADATGMSLMFKDSSDTDIGHFYVQFSSGSLTWVNDITSQQIPIQ